MSQHAEQAEKFVQDAGATMNIEFQFHGPHFAGEKESRDVYRVEIRRGGKSMAVAFGQSLADSGQKRVKPTPYDVLASLQKHEPEMDVWDFANEYGYEINDRESYMRVSRIHMAVQQEYEDVLRVFGDVLERLQEIS
jgi:hypothetical protein